MVLFFNISFYYTIRKKVALVTVIYEQIFMWGRKVRRCIAELVKQIFTIKYRSQILSFIALAREQPFNFFFFFNLFLFLCLHTVSCVLNFACVHWLHSWLLLWFSLAFILEWWGYTFFQRQISITTFHKKNILTWKIQTINNI